MNDDSILGATLNQLGQTAKKTVRQVVSLPEEKPAAIAEPKQENKPQQQWQSDEERVKFLRDLYGSAEQTSSSEKNPAPQTGKKPAEVEEQKKMLELRNQLHKENYYDPTFNRPQNPPAGGEERPAEKVENEKKEEMQDLQQKDAKKPPPLAVVREQNKTEMFRGASG